MMHWCIPTVCLVKYNFQAGQGVLFQLKQQAALVIYNCVIQLPGYLISQSV